MLHRKKGERHFLVLLDGVEDPHNLGALLRSADATGADGVVIPGAPRRGGECDGGEGVGGRVGVCSA